LITNIIFESRRNFSFLRFYGRRILRLYPIVIAYSAVVILWFYLAGKEIVWLAPLSALGYFANYYYSMGDLGPMPFDIFWSLSIEEHFYIILPPLMWMLRFDLHRLSLVMVAVIIGCLFLRIAVALNNPDLVGTYYFYLRSEFRLDSIAFGVLLACLYKDGLWLRSIFWLICGLGMILFGLVVRDPLFRDTLRFSAVGLGIFFCIGWLLTRGKTVLDLPFAVWVGGLSYSIYVWHLLAPHICAWLTPGVPKWIEVPELLVITLALATLSYYGIERPCLHLRGRLESQRGSR
jgi:peptidoglycan/LPS O-acetylase OafA/YrhL